MPTIIDFEPQEKTPEEIMTAVLRLTLYNHYRTELLMKMLDVEDRDIIEKIAQSAEAKEHAQYLLGLNDKSLGEKVADLIKETLG